MFTAPAAAATYWGAVGMGATKLDWGYVGKQLLNNEPINKHAVAIIEVKIPGSVYDKLDLTSLDSTIFKSGTATVQPDMLSFFNKNILRIKHKF